MKTYVNYMEEISKEELFKGLLGYGMFADKLPPIFSSKEFYDYCVSHLPLTYCKNPHDYVRYNTMRNTGIMRSLGIPNPFAYAYLCQFLFEHWNTDLIPYFKFKTRSQPFCYSQIHLQKKKDEESLFRMNIDYSMKDFDLEDYLQTLPIAKRYKVVTDISNCFPSIYSHALSWALVGKETAKREKDDETKWFNQLDKVNINLKYRETNGQLIGPHASNLLSEIVLVAVDEMMCSKGYYYVRMIDDITYYAISHEDAENFIREYATALKAFDLQINEKKTKISNLSESEEEWVNQLKCFYIGSEKTEDGKIVFRKSRLEALMYMAKRLAIDYGNMAVFLYAIKMIADTYLGKKSKIYYINEIHQLLLKNTYLAPYMERLIFSPLGVLSSAIKSIADSLYDVGIRTNNYEACSYAIYWALRYDFELSAAQLCHDAINSEDCVLKLLGFCYAKKHKLVADVKEYKNNAKSYSGVDIDRNWLFIYEVLPKSDLLDADMKTIKNAGVSFISDAYRC